MVGMPSELRVRPEYTSAAPEADLCSGASRFGRVFGRHPSGRAEKL